MPTPRVRPKGAYTRKQSASRSKPVRFGARAALKKAFMGSGRGSKKR